jgi:hypothetical protein
MKLQQGLIDNNNSGHREKAKIYTVAYKDLAQDNAYIIL